MKNKDLFIVLFTVVLSLSFSYGQTSIRKSIWKGFERINFKLEGKEAHLTSPKKPLPGNPWLWRARFPG
jgi:sialidase-1